MSSVVDDLAEVRKLGTRERWNAFRQHPVWAEIHAHWKAQHDQMLSSYGTRALRGNLSEKEAAELNGYWRGVMAVLEGRDYEAPRRTNKEGL